jgi:hypothetical protein
MRCEFFPAFHLNLNAVCRISSEDTLPSKAIYLDGFAFLGCASSSDCGTSSYPLSARSFLLTWYFQWPEAIYLLQLMPSLDKGFRGLACLSDVLGESSLPEWRWNGKAY